MLPFTVQRRIAWGECDPARIGYTPRAIDYAVEAVEAWYEMVLGVSLVELVKRYALDSPFVQVDCDYRRPLVASQVVDLQVWVTKAGRSTVTFAVVGDDGDGEPCFLAHLVARFVERKTNISHPTPSELRRRIETYQAECGEVATDLGGGDRSGLFPGKTEESHETDETGHYSLPTNAAVFTRQRRVVYGDCDASGMIYAPRVFDYAVEVIGEWYEDVLGISWMDLVCKREQGAPFVSARCEYLRPMAPGQSITVAVWVTWLGGASIRFAVMGYDADGKSCFDAHLAACFIEQNGFKAVRIPEEFRRRIQAYQSACEALEGDKTELA